MAKEVLAVSERYLLDVVRVLRNGLDATDQVPGALVAQLRQWCVDMEDYVDACAAEDIDE